MPGFWEVKQENVFHKLQTFHFLAGNKDLHLVFLDTGKTFFSLKGETQLILK